MNESSSNQRNHPRHDIPLQASLQAAGVVVPCRVHNISASGALIEANAHLRIGDRTTVMMDSGIRSGPDVARALASGARFTFLGRSFMYGVAALGARGGDHTVAILRAQLQQVLEQLCCERVGDLPDRLVRPD